MVSDNERIAKIDGKCACKGPAYSTSVSSAGPPSCHVCHKPHRPDYEHNTGELVRVILKICEEKGLYCGIDLCGKDYNYVTIFDPKVDIAETGEVVSSHFKPPVTVEKINAALAAAMLEAADVKR